MAKQNKNQSTSNNKHVSNDKRPGGIHNASNHKSWRNYLTLWNLWKFILALAVGLIHKHHVSNLFEKDRHFSHLSTLEREMGFRTEMGLYYSYFKTVIEAPSFLSGVGSLMSNNITEYPDTINTLKRFNLYPEVALGAAFRIYQKVGEMLNWKTKMCYSIDRGEGFSTVESCEGLGDPSFFYLEGVWTSAGITTFLLFLLGTQLSGDSCLGGLFAVLCFFYNHGEATRVQWTPPLRESFAFPLSFLQQFMLTRILSSPDSSGSNRLKIIGLAISTTWYILVWQFAQFSLFTQFFAVYLIHTLNLISRDVTKMVFMGIFYGLVASWILMFGNEMLVTSWLFCCLMTAVIIFYLIDPLLVKFKSEFKFEIPSIILAIFKPVLLLAGTVAFKIVIGKILSIRDDAHIGAILRSKFTNYRDFHTLLYTCAKEFDFLGWEMPHKTTMTLLIPSGVLAMLLVGLHMLTTVYNGRFALVKKRHYCLVNSSSDIVKQVSVNGGTSHNNNEASVSKNSSQQPNVTTERLDIDPVMCYHVLQTAAFCLMAIIIMRLKLFFTPQLCILSALLLNTKYVPFIRSRALHLSLIALLVAGMSMEGVSNIKKQHNTMGEYSNPQLEELIEWINATVPVEASFAGPMPVMANLLLSTRRPIVNHPHYEDAGLRERTKRVYEIYSRHTAADYHKTMVDLQVQYVVAARMWCFQTARGDGCAMIENWDSEEPHNKNKGTSLCRKLFGKSDNNIEKEVNPVPFKRVFRNEEYCVLKV